MGKTIKFFIITLFSPIVFLFPSLARAADTPYLITNYIPFESTLVKGATFFTTSFKVNYQTGQIILSSTPDGNGPMVVDDGIEITVKKPNGQINIFTKRFDLNCWYLQEGAPSDISYLFSPGENQVSIRLHDICGGNIGSTALYLTNLGAPEPLPTKTPVVFIPGIAGSELRVDSPISWSQPDGHGGTYNHTYPTGENIWLNLGQAALPGQDDYFDVLRMKADGITSEASLILTGNLISQAYQPTIDFFNNNGYTKDKDFFVFPYDWRKDIGLTAPLLDQKIEEIKAKTGSQKVDLVAHSMGGLVARNYISDPGRASKVRKLINLGTPHLGSVNFLKNLMYGDCLTIKQIFKNPICFGISPSETKDIAQNLMSGFELSPTKKYFDFYSGKDNLHPLPFSDIRDIDNNTIRGPLNYEQIKTLLTNLKYNTSLFNTSENFHNLDSTYSNTNGVEVSIIAGSGTATLGQISENYSINFLGIKIPHKDELIINGDETVPLFSASLSDQNNNLFLTGTSKVYYTNQSHGNLPKIGTALDLVKNILDSSNQLPEGVSAQPYPLKGNMLSVHSPVNIHVYDQNNNHTGPTSNGDFEANIPGSSLDTLDDAKFIWLPDDGQYSVKFESTGIGSFDFKIRNYSNDINTQTTLYKNIPLTSTTKADTIFNTSSQTPPVINLDNDGNGTPDSQISTANVLTGNTVYDQTPPKTVVTTANPLLPESGSIRLNGMTTTVTVNISAADETGGSGIDKTEYTLDGGKTVQIYKGPFTVLTQQLSLLKARSIDKAGNEEVPVGVSAPTINKIVVSPIPSKTP